MSEANPQAVTAAFSDTEWNALHKDDIYAGRILVGLMFTIFALGLLLYLGVLYACRVGL